MAATAHPIFDKTSPTIDPPPKGRLHPSCREMVGVLEAPGESKLVATRRIGAGERLFQIEGQTTNRPTRHTVQIDEELHLDIPDGHRTDEIFGRYFWRFINHACEPTALIQGRDVIAQREIRPGEAVTYNYNTTEWDMDEPFKCHCGSANCLKEIRGFKHLTAAERARLRGVAPHLKRSAERETRDNGTSAQCG